MISVDPAPMTLGRSMRSKWLAILALAQDDAAGCFLEQELKMSCLLSNVRAVPGDERDLLDSVADCIVVVSVESCLSCESGYWMNIAGSVVVVVVVAGTRKQKEKVAVDRYFCAISEYSLVYWRLC
jgi:hypothetical protein